MTVASAVVLSALADLPRDRGVPNPQPARDTQLAEQPLIGLGGGVSVRELTWHKPFSMIGLTGDLASTSTRVRARRPDGSWGPWYLAEYETGAPDPVGPADATRPAVPAEGPRSTEPVFVGTTTAVQIAITRPLDAPVTKPLMPLPAPTGLGYRPVSTGQPFGQNISAILISPPQAPNEKHWTMPFAVIPPNQPPTVISRAEWGADESVRCPYDDGIRAAVVHHTAGSNDYSPLESAGIVKAIYAYHTQTLGWCDIAYNALVDKYGQVFEGAAGGLDRAVRGTHTGGFNHNTWGVALLGDFNDVAPTPIQLQTLGRLIGWRLNLDHVNPTGTAALTSSGGGYTNYPAGAIAKLPAIFAHRDVGNTDCPGHIVYAAMNEIREIAAHFNDQPAEVVNAERTSAILGHWLAMGGVNSVLGAPTSPEAGAAGNARYATFAKGAMYWSPEIGAEPIGGAIYQAWASLSYERGPLGLPTSAEIQEPLWITQNFQHGTLNYERLTGQVTEVIDGIATPLTPPGGPAVLPEHFSPPVNPNA